MNTITGALVAPLWAQTLSVRQSSLPLTVPSAASCGHTWPSVVKLRSSAQHAAGSGGAQRKRPTGGAAYGRPSQA